MRDRSTQLGLYTDFMLSFKSLQEHVRAEGVAAKLGPNDDVKRKDVENILGELACCLGGNKKRVKSVKMPAFNAPELAYADIILAVMDMAQRRKLHVAEAVIAKINSSAKR